MQTKLKKLRKPSRRWELDSARVSIPHTKKGNWVIFQWDVLYNPLVNGSYYCSDFLQKLAHTMEHKGFKAQAKKFAALAEFAMDKEYSGSLNAAKL